ncbi:MAG: hypothetical protein ACI4UA_08095, partial [Bacteroidaceae bacterium]
KGRYTLNFILNERAVTRDWGRNSSVPHLPHSNVHPQIPFLSNAIKLFHPTLPNKKRVISEQYYFMGKISVRRWRFKSA